MNIAAITSSFLISLVLINVAKTPTNEPSMGNSRFESMEVSLDISNTSDIYVGIHVIALSFTKPSQKIAAITNITPAASAGLTKPRPTFSSVLPVSEVPILPNFLTA